MLIGFMAAGLTSRIDPRLGMAFGFALQTVAGLWMLTFDLNVTMEILLLNSAVQGFAVGCVWVPMTIVTFDTLDMKHRAEASSVFHLLRNIGSSFFISLSIAEIVRTTGANYSRMVEMITPFNHALTLPSVSGAWNFDTVAGLAKVANEIGAAIGDDRLSQRLHDVHGDLGARGRARADGPAQAVNLKPAGPRPGRRDASELIAASNAATTASISLVGTRNGVPSSMASANASSRTRASRPRGKVSCLRALAIRRDRQRGLVARLGPAFGTEHVHAPVGRAGADARELAGPAIAEGDLQRNDVARVGRRLALEQSCIDLRDRVRRG